MPPEMVRDPTHPLAATTHPGYDILRAAHVELRVRDLEVARRFYVDALDLVVAHESADAVHLRGWEERGDHSIVLRVGEPGIARLGFRVRSDEDLTALARTFEASGRAVSWAEGEPGQGPVVRTSDPFGFPLAFHARMAQVEPQLQRFDLQRGAPILRFDHFNLHVPDVAEAAAFWLSQGFRCSEFIEADGGSFAGAWLLRKSSVHDVALTAGRGPRLHHIGLWVGEPAGILRACDQLAAAGHASAIERGPGRHGVSNAFFVYLRDPDGHRIELYSCDYYTGDPDLMPLRWRTSDPTSRSFWGTRAPDSWYEESTPVVQSDGATAALVDPEVDERSELMA